MDQPGGGFGLMRYYNMALAFERGTRRVICAVVGHREVRAIGEFQTSTCLRCRESIDAPDVGPRYPKLVQLAHVQYPTAEKSPARDYVNV
jgi:hypothetical protein